MRLNPLSHIRSPTKQYTITAMIFEALEDELYIDVERGLVSNRVLVMRHEEDEYYFTNNAEDLACYIKPRRRCPFRSYRKMEPQETVALKEIDSIGIGTKGIEIIHDADYFRALHMVMLENGYKKAKTGIEAGEPVILTTYPKPVEDRTVNLLTVDKTYFDKKIFPS